MTAIQHLPTGPIQLPQTSRVEVSRTSETTSTSNHQRQRRRRSNSPSSSSGGLPYQTRSQRTSQRDNYHANHPKNTTPRRPLDEEDVPLITSLFTAAHRTLTEAVLSTQQQSQHSSNDRREPDLINQEDLDNLLRINERLFGRHSPPPNQQPDDPSSPSDSTASDHPPSHPSSNSSSPGPSVGSNDPPPQVDPNGQKYHRDLPVQNILAAVRPSFLAVWDRLLGRWVDLIRTGAEANDPDRYTDIVECFRCLPILTLHGDGLPLSAETARNRFIHLSNIQDEETFIEAINALATTTRQQHQLVRITAGNINHPAINNNPDHINHQDQILIKRAKTFIHNGLLAKALSVVENRKAKVLTPEECQQPHNSETIRRLHPQHDEDRDTLPADIPDLPALQLDLDDLVEGLKKLPRQSAPAMSSYTNELLRQLLGEDRTAQLSMLALFNHILNGHLIGPTFLQDSRLVMLEKNPEAHSLRPIAVGETIYRFLGRLVSKKVAGELGQRLLPGGQLGIGITGGVELASHAVGAAADKINKRHFSNDVEWKAAEEADPTSVLILDATNAFNSVGRRAQYEGVIQHLPSLLKFYMWAYGSHPPLFLSDGSLMCWSETGVRQGDPLGPILFCLAIQIYLVRTKQALPQSLLALFAYLDDITVIGPRSVCLAAKELLKAFLEPIGIKFENAKQKIWDSTIEHDYVDEETQMQYVKEGIVVVGVPHGLIDPITHIDDSYAARQLSSLLDEHEATLECVQRLLPVNYGFPIVQCCVQGRINYLMRNLRPEITNRASKAFGDGIITLLSYWVDTPLPPVSAIVLSLPAVHGGASLPSSNAVRKAAYIAAFLSWASHATTLMPRLFESWALEPGLADEDSYIHQLLSPVPHFNRVDDQGVHFDQRPRPRQPGENAAAPEIMLPGYCLKYGVQVPHTPPLTQHVLTTPIHAHRRGIVLHTLPQHSTQRAWFLSGSAPRAFKWAHSSVTTNRTVHLTETEYKINLRLRLLIPDRPPHQLPILVTHCPNCLNPVSHHDHLHFLSCKSNSGFWVQCHDEVTGHFVDFLKSVLPPDQVRTEIELQGATTVAYSDIRIANPTGEVHIDVTIPNPAALSKGPALQDPNYSTARAEAIKRANYTRILGPETASRVKIAAIDRTGRYGAGATSFMSYYTRQQHIGNVQPYLVAAARKQMETKISSTIARYNGRMFTAWKNKKVQLPQEPQPEDLGGYLAEYGYNAPQPLPGPLDFIGD